PRREPRRARLDECANLVVDFIFDLIERAVLPLARRSTAFDAPWADTGLIVQFAEDRAVVDPAARRSAACAGVRALHEAACGNRAVEVWKGWQAAHARGYGVGARAVSERGCRRKAIALSGT